jgi:hypothetical protein
LLKNKLQHLLTSIEKVSIVFTPMEPASAVELTPEYVAFTNAPHLLAMAGSAFSIAAAVVLLRIYVRILVVKSFGRDDWAMVVALVSPL